MQCTKGQSFSQKFAKIEMLVHSWQFMLRTTKFTKIINKLLFLTGNRVLRKKRKTIVYLGSLFFQKLTFKTL